MSEGIKRAGWLRLVVPGLMAVALMMGTVSAAAASSAPVDQTTVQAANFPAQEGEDGDQARPQGRRGNGERVAVIATAICENQDLFVDAAVLGTLCSLYQGDVLPEEVNHSIGCTIVKYVKHTAPEALRTLVESLDIERPERPEGDDGNRGRPRFEQGSEGFGQRGFGQQGGFGQGQSQS